jgi:anaerobic dimethyl sulfoxide reductase subunit B (iron-sulfur subunit)
LSRRLFVVNVGRCTGCNACSIACKDRAGLPDDVDFLRVERSESGRYPNVTLYYWITHCFHCETPPCVDACPTQAIAKTKKGFIDVNVERCDNCGKCKDVCPFDSIVELPEGFHAKCDGCYDEVAKGWNPTCVRACPMRALSFQSINEVDLATHHVHKDFSDYGIGPAVLYVCTKPK